jgi:UDP-2,3-diacylglucosamine pyrophosphatase LpxH
MLAKSKSNRGKIIAISDTHFGDSSSLLDKNSLVDRLAGVLADRGRVSELILLGDILDLWVKTSVPALRKARYFIDTLSRLENIERIVYVPGNHDHQMFLDAFRLEVDVRVMQGDLTIPRFMPARAYGETVISGLAHPKTKVHFSMTYPFIVREVAGKEVIFTHGHHLDFYAASHGWARTFWLGRHIINKRRKKATLHDIEMANIPFCGAMSTAPWVPELVNEGLRYYRIISFFSRLFRAKSLQQSPLRDSLIKDNYQEIRQLLPQLECPRPACFVFGHTHRPGMGRLPDSEVIIANTGSWTRTEDGEVPARTWVEVDGQVNLFSLTRSGDQLLETVSLESQGDGNGLP